MRYIVNSDNCVVAVSFGSEVVYNDCECVEYTGTIPEGWSSLEEWHEDECEKLWRWKIVDGNLTLNSEAVAPEEGWMVPNSVLVETEISSWGSTVTIENDAITATSPVELLPGKNITAAQLAMLQGANIIGGTQTDGSIQLKVMGDNPSGAIPVVMIIRRDL